MGTNLCSHDCIQIAFESWKSEYFSRGSIRVIDLKKKKEILYFETNVNRFINPDFFFINRYNNLVKVTWALFYKEIYLIIFNRIVWW